MSASESLNFQTGKNGELAPTPGGQGPHPQLFTATALTAMCHPIKFFQRNELQIYNLQHQLSLCGCFLLDIV